MTQVDWKPWPKEKPKECKEYLITCFDGIREDLCVNFDYFDPKRGWDLFDKDGDKVTAWAELPEPYKGEAND